MSLDDTNDTFVPLPLDPLPNDDNAKNRLWIGNIDGRITEYNLIKILQKYGKVVSFNFLFHKTGPLTGQPRGYCFVTYETIEQAQNALQKLDGKLALTKKLSVKWASSQTIYDGGQPEDRQVHPKDKQTTSKNPLSVASKINAIETKLKMMEENKEHEDMSVPILQFLKTANEQKSTQSFTNQSRRKPYSRPSGRRKPYTR